MRGRPGNEARADIVSGERCPIFLELLDFKRKAGSYR